MFRRGNCIPIHLSIIVMEIYAPRTTSKNLGFGSIYSTVLASILVDDEYPDLRLLELLDPM